MLSKARTPGRRGPMLFVMFMIAMIVAACGAGSAGAPVPAGLDSGGKPDVDQGTETGGNTDGGQRDVAYLVGGREAQAARVTTKKIAEMCLYWRGAVRSPARGHCFSSLRSIGE